MIGGQSGVLTHLDRFAPRPGMVPQEQLRRGLSLANRVLCGVGGHTRVLHFEPARLSLRCLTCGAETPGWTIEVHPGSRRPPGRRE